MRAGDVDVGVGVAGQPAQGAGGGQPQDLLDRAVHQPRVGAQGVALVGVVQQEQGAEVDPGHGGLVPGEQQPRGHPGDGLVGELVPVLRGEQVGDHVLAGSVSLDLHQLVHVANETAHRRHRRVAVGRPGHPLRPAPEPLPVLVGHAEQLADHQHR